MQIDIKDKQQMFIGRDTVYEYITKLKYGLLASVHAHSSANTRASI
jgi:hypothetical protein